MVFKFLKYSIFWAFNSYALNYAKIFYRIANFSPFSLCRFLLLWIDLETFSLQLLLLKVKCVFGNEMRHLTLMALFVSYSTRIHSRYDLRKNRNILKENKIFEGIPLKKQLKDWTLYRRIFKIFFNFWQVGRLVFKGINYLNDDDIYWNISREW